MESIAVSSIHIGILRLWNPNALATFVSVGIQLNRSKGASTHSSRYSASTNKAHYKEISFKFQNECREPGG